MKKCRNCNKELGDYRSTLCMSCSKSGDKNPMFGLKGNKCPIWKGGRRILKNGYVQITIDGKRIYEHRYLMEKKLQRRLNRKEIVHHIDGNTTNNELENLELLRSQNIHTKNHRTGIPWNKNNTELQRQCYKCHIIKELNEENFYKQKNRMYGFSYICRKCNNA